MDRLAASQRIKELARAAGFQLAGIARLGPASTAGAYGRWLARGDQAGMSWMERHGELRGDPRRLLRGARSALVVGLRYAPVEEAAGDPAPGDLWPRVARYARGRDYHELLRERLEGVASEVASLHPGARHRVCVDTAPVLERELAVGAGLGAIGKNTCLLSPTEGSYVLLGELLLTLDLAPDQPVADLCGECSRCLEACPTGALPEPYRLDARLCLSYWTIEHRGEIPEPLRPHLRERVFGCDICQEVCPWNRDQPPVAGDEFAVAPARRGLGLVELLGLDEAGYRRLFRGSPMRRAKREGLRRNAALALAGSSDRAARSALEGVAAEEPGGAAAEAAAWAAGRGAGTRR